MPAKPVPTRPLLHVLDVFGVGWVGKCLAQGTAATAHLPKMTHDPTFSS